MTKQGAARQVTGDNMMRDAVTKATYTHTHTHTHTLSLTQNV